MNNILGGETVMARFWSDLVSSFKCYLDRYSEWSGDVG